MNRENQQKLQSQMKKTIALLSASYHELDKIYVNGKIPRPEYMRLARKIKNAQLSVCATSDIISTSFREQTNQDRTNMKQEAKIQICDRFLAFVDSLQAMSNTVTSLYDSGDVSNKEATQILNAIEQILKPAEVLSDRICTFKKSIQDGQQGYTVS